MSGYVEGVLSRIIAVCMVVGSGVFLCGRECLWCMLLMDCPNRQECV